MRVVVTGGRGNIGRWSVDELVRAGHEVTAIVRAEDEPPADLLRPTEELFGEAGDAGLLARAMDGADGVVHLAAIAAPTGRTAVELLLANSVTTMAVLEAAGEAGVRGAVIASSLSALGMAWSEEWMSPLLLPVDEEHPLRPAEGYGLSKEQDEASARMAARRWGMPVVALRFPFVHTMETIRARSASTDPEVVRTLARELWGYLDVRDAARAVRLSLEAAVAGRIEGSLVLTVAADDLAVDGTLADLVHRWHPDYLGPVPESGGAYDVSRAERILSFRAEHSIRAG